ncbi:MAG: hypothetical protein ACTH2U_14645, partial [Brevibacterium sp.]
FGRAVTRVVRESFSTSEAQGESRISMSRMAVSRLGERLSSPVPRALIAVTLAMGGIATALLIGIAPLIWTLVSIAALLTSLVLAATMKAQIPAESEVPTVTDRVKATASLV